MYHKLRTLHRWIGLLSALVLLIIAVTGFLLATKGTFGWIRPPEKDGQPVDSLSEVVSVEQAAEAAFAAGIAELQSRDDIDRIDYRPDSNVFKIVSNEGYYEVQVDGKTGEVIQIARRVDQLSEDIHDLSFFGDAFHGYLLPLVACGLFLLSLSGIAMFFVPVVRRWRYRKKLRRKGT